MGKTREKAAGGRANRPSVFARLNRARSAGFTLAEMLVAVGILMVLLAVAIPSVMTIRRDLKMTELDDVAREIFVAAQNRLTALNASGGLNRVGGTKLDAEPEAAPSGAASDYYYVTAGSAGANVLLPPGAIDETVRGGHYIIKYNKRTAMVFEVFYAEGAFEEDYINPGLSDDKAERKSHDPMLGYYGGADVERPEIGEAPTFKLINEEELYVKLQIEAGTTYLVTVRSANSAEDGPQSNFKIEIDLAGTIARRLDNCSDVYSEENKNYCNLVLDSLNLGANNTSQHFKDLCKELTSGTDIEVTVTASRGETSSLPVTSLPENSLFDSLSEKEGILTAEIAYGRQLQNLEKWVSNLDVEVTAAEQTSAITWTYEAPFAPINNAALLSYDGKGNEIRNLNCAIPEKIANDPNNKNSKYVGLFGYVDGGSICRVRLVDPVLHAEKNVENAGALVGLAQNTTIEDCQVYAKAPGAASIESPGANAGGLVGRASSCTIQNCSASLLEIRGQTAGGLVGSMDGNSSVSQCYADTGYRTSIGWEGGIFAENDFGAGGLIGYVYGSGMKTISSSYAVGYIASAKTAGGFMTATQSATCINCYSAVQFGEGITGKRHGFSNSGTLRDCFYLKTPDAEGDGGLSFAQLQKQDFNGGLVIVEGDTTAYTPGICIGDYPLPRIKGLPHYGDWPEEITQAEGLAYYEKYADGSYGYHLDPGDGTDVLNTLREGFGFTAVEDGYAVLLRNTGATELTVSYRGKDGTQSESLKPMTADINGASYSVFLLTPGGNVLTQSIPANDKTGYHALTYGGRRCWFIPDFAKTAINGTEEPTGGPGTLYVRTARHLAHLAADAALWGREFKQELDVDFAKYTGVVGLKLTPIGNSSVKFLGSYDGKEHSITGVDIVQGGDYVGLFGYVGVDQKQSKVGTLKNILFLGDEENRVVSGGDSVGALVGYNDFGVIENCAAAGFDVSGAHHVGGLVGHNKGTIRDCAAANGSFNADSPGGSVTASGSYGFLGGFVGLNEGDINSSYAMASVSYTGASDDHIYQGGFAGSNRKYTADWFEQFIIKLLEKWFGWEFNSGNIQNCYCAAVSGEDWLDFLGYGSGTNCLALNGENFKDLVGFTGGSFTAAGKADAAHTYPYDAALQGKAYLFPAVIERDGALVHYGNWPTNDMKNAALAYYEVYKDGSIAFYNEELGLKLSSNEKTIVQDGYCLLLLGDKEGNGQSTTSGGIKLAELAGAVSLQWNGGSGKGVTADSFGFEVSYDRKKLGSGSNGKNSVIKVGSKEYFPLFLPAKAVVSVAAPGEGFYQSLTVSDTNGAERTFWYNPHFAKSEIGVNKQIDTSGGITAYIRTERHFATLATQANGKAYWAAGITYVQERNLTPVTGNPYVTSYFGTDLTKSPYVQYRSGVDRLGDNFTAFGAVYDGEEDEGHTLDLKGKEYSTNDTIGMGVFGVLSGGTVQNLTVKNVTVNGGSSAARLGGLVGSMTGKSRIESVELENVTVTGNNLVGGAIGRLSGGTVAALTVDGATVTGARIVGGAFGQIINEEDIIIDGIGVFKSEVESTKSITSSINQSNQDNGFGTGGFAGACVLTKTYGVTVGSVEVNETDISVEQINDSQYTYHGGAAYIGNVFIKENRAVLNLGEISLNECEVKAEGGGGVSAYGILIGRLKAVGTLEIDRYYNNVEIMSISDCEIDGENCADAAIGGYFGAITTDTTLTLSLPWGTVNASEVTLSGCESAANLGGFVGRMSGKVTLDTGDKFQFTNVNLQGGGNVGGFAGSVSGGRLENIRVSGEVSTTGGGNTGGFVGRVEREDTTALFRSCYAACAVDVQEETDNSYTGGFLGYIQAGAVLDCYSVGAVTVNGKRAETDRTGGFLGGGADLMIDNNVNGQNLGFMVELYGLLEDTLVINRTGSAAVKKDDMLDTTACKNVIDYLHFYNSKNNKNLPLNSGVVMSNAAEGQWNNETGELTVDGSASWNVIYAIKDKAEYEDLRNGTWMIQAQDNGQGDIEIYWTPVDINANAGNHESGQKIDAYRYVAAAGRFYYGTMTIERQSWKEREDSYLALSTSGAEWKEASVVSIDCRFLYADNGQNWHAEEDSEGAYTDYKYYDIQRWLIAQFQKELTPVQYNWLFNGN